MSTLAVATPMDMFDLGPVVKMPIVSTRIEFEGLGYPGWVAVLRLNPKSSDIDNLNSPEAETEWKGIGSIVLAWNFGDEDGNAYPLPKDCTRTECEVPIAVLRYMLTAFRERFDKSSELPKGSDTNSESSS